MPIFFSHVSIDCNLNPIRINYSTENQQGIIEVSMELTGYLSFFRSGVNSFGSRNSINLNPFKD